MGHGLQTDQIKRIFLVLEQIRVEMVLIKQVLVMDRSVIGFDS